MSNFTSAILCLLEGALLGERIAAGVLLMYAGSVKLNVSDVKAYRPDTNDRSARCGWKPYQ